MVKNPVAPLGVSSFLPECELGVKFYDVYAEQNDQIKTNVESNLLRMVVPRPHYSI